MGVGAGLGGRSVLNVHGEASGKLHSLTPKTLVKSRSGHVQKPFVKSQSGLVIIKNNEKKLFAGHMCRLLMNPTIVREGILIKLIIIFFNFFAKCIVLLALKSFFTDL